VVRLAHIPKLTEGQIGTGFDRECVSSNPLTPASQSGARRKCPRRSEKGPPMAGFCELATSFWAPILAILGAK